MSLVAICGLDKTVSNTVEEAFESAGLFKHIKRGQKVLIKPNLVAVPPVEPGGGVTMAEVSEGVALLVEKAGAKAIIADSSAVGVRTEDVIQTTGYLELRNKGYEVRDLKEDKTIDFNGFESYETINEVDVIISLPVMKTHDQLEVSLGMKNLKGLLSDGEKKNFHNKYDLAKALISFISNLMKKKKMLSVMDGIVALEGRGPVFGTPVEMGYILASEDLVALDLIAAKMMGVPWELLRIETEGVKSLSQSTFGRRDDLDLDKIKITGAINHVDEIPVRTFDRNKEVEINANEFALNFSDRTCTGCKNTVLSCLETMKENGKEVLLEGKKIFAGGSLTEFKELKELKNGFNEIKNFSKANEQKIYLVGFCLTNSLRCELNHGIAKKAVLIDGCPPENNRVMKSLEQKVIDI